MPACNPSSLIRAASGLSCGLMAQLSQAAVPIFMGREIPDPWDLPDACRQYQAQAIVAPDPPVSGKETGGGPSNRYRFIVSFERTLPSNEELRSSGLGEFTVIERYAPGPFLVLSMRNPVPRDLLLKLHALPGLRAAEP